MEQFLLRNNVEFASKKAKVLTINTGGTFGFQPVNPGESDEVVLKPNSLKKELQSSSGNYGTICHPKADNSEEKPYLENDYSLMWIYELDPLLDSSDMEMKHWTLICKLIKEAYAYFDGFVVLHGTNTMAYTASAISFMIKASRQKPRKHSTLSHILA